MAIGKTYNTISFKNISFHFTKFYDIKNSLLALFFT